MKTTLLSYCILSTAAFVNAAISTDDTPDGRLLESVMTNPYSLDKVKKALSEGANINVQCDQSGQTPLMASTLRGSTDIVRYLLDQGADVTIPEKDGYTPPHGAGFQGRPDVMKMLKEHGLDIFEFHKDGFAPFHRACWGGTDHHAETVKYFLEQGVDVNLLSTGDTKMTCLEMTQNESTKALLKKYNAGDAKMGDEM